MEPVYLENTIDLYGIKNMKNCNVCNNTGIIRVAVYHHAKMINLDAPLKHLEAHRTYPCPECSEEDSSDKVKIVQYYCNVDLRNKDTKYIYHITRDISHRIADKLFEDGYINFEIGPDNAFGWFPVKATLGVVSTNQVKNIQQRITEYAEKVVNESFNELIERVVILKGSIQKAHFIDILKAVLTENINRIKMYDKKIN